MTKERWNELMDSDTLPLSEEEYLLGWHFCPDFDGLLQEVGDVGCGCSWVDYEY